MLDGGVLAKLSSKMEGNGKLQELKHPRLEQPNGNPLREIRLPRVEKPDLETVKNSSMQQLLEENKGKMLEVKNALEQETRAASEGQENSDETGEKKGLSEEEKAKIKEMTGWSDEIIDSIGSMKEAEIYMKAGLHEAEINGKKCLIRSDIDWDQKDEMGRTNRERAEQGLSPITKDGKTVELHHIGQHADSPLAELTTEEHRGKGNDAVLHDKTKESEIDRQEFAKERSEHWEARAQEESGS